MSLCKCVVVISRNLAQQALLVDSIASLGGETSCYDTINTADADMWVNPHDGIGIIAIHELLSLPRKDIENFLCSSNIVWLGIVPAKNRSNPFLNELACLMHCVFSLPIDDATLGYLLDSACHQVALKNRIRDIHSINVDGIILKSYVPKVKKIFRLLHRIGDSKAPVMILGESGTGKELVARAIHDLSIRASGPFIALNCGALSDELIQSELFGYEKGAFTGASKHQVGHIEAASGGTLFLDEIGDLNTPLQANLLRFLESRSIQRLSSSHEISVDVRVVSATHVDLIQAVNNGYFRLDLFHRLNTIVINLPPLRERKADIEVLANQILDDVASRYPTQVKGFHPDTINLMRYYHWPGNIREMLNKIKSAAALSNSKRIMPEDINIKNNHKKHTPPSLNEIKCAAERRLIKNVLIKNAHNIAQSAKEMGISRVTFYRLAKKYNMLNYEGVKYSH
ncbi:sigma-54-dependent Fis family transcriptional regulator [Halomonas sp. ML-15]|uniref:sigma-54 interaction domain-containing protein n=1 Tax=Halomonas sp. ML-15 TaxID=2773305 RepID=UPI00174737B4|nr:sigma-54 dependent transcriptional regulator [Halomonas sp. ML-15]MBD3897036.1 sigma-54-dependent Fis family transcriptional regulator [Halomonas sp. ML-15]